MKVRNFFNKMMDTRTSASNEGVIKISGIFNGCICNGSHVFVTASGILKGEVQTKRLVIDGTVKGKIKADSLVIRSSGKVIYERLKYKDIIAEDGALISFSEASEGLDFIGQSVLDEVYGLREDNVQSTESDIKLFALKDKNARHSNTIESSNAEVSLPKPQIQKKPNNLVNSRMKGQPLFQSSF